MTNRVFISYRREDSADVAQDLYYKLVGLLDPAARNLIFLDNQTLRSGTEFSLVLQQAISRSRVVLVLIGPNWVDAKDAQGNRRLEDPLDWVRREIEFALSFHPAKRIIPIILPGASMPRRARLPHSLQRLCDFHAHHLGGSQSYPHQLEALAREIRLALSPTGIQRLRFLAHPLVAGALVVSALTVWAMVVKRQPIDPVPQATCHGEALLKPYDTAVPLPVEFWRNSLLPPRDFARLLESGRDLEIVNQTNDCLDVHSLPYYYPGETRLGWSAIRVQKGDSHQEPAIVDPFRGGWRYVVIEHPETQQRIDIGWLDFGWDPSVRLIIPGDVFNRQPGRDAVHLEGQPTDRQLP